MLLQKVTEQMVVPVPAGLFIDRLQKQVKAHQLFQLGLAAGAFGNLVAQLRHQQIKIGRIAQEFPGALREVSNHIAGQKLHHIRVAGLETLDELVRRARFG